MKIPRMPKVSIETFNKKTGKHQFYVPVESQSKINSILKKYKKKGIYSQKICEAILLGESFDRVFGDRTSTEQKKEPKTDDFLNNNKSICEKILDKVNQPKELPRLDEYHEKKIGGKTIVDAFEKKKITLEQATAIIVGAKEIVAEACNTELFRHMNMVKSKRDTKKVHRVKRFYNKVKESLHVINPYSLGMPKPKPEPMEEDFDEEESEIVGEVINPDDYDSNGIRKPFKDIHKIIEEEEQEKRKNEPKPVLQDGDFDEELYEEIEETPIMADILY